MSLDLSTLWDFSQPALSEERFRAALVTAAPTDALILHTQIARTYGLRREFERARAILAEIAPQVTQRGDEAEIRYWLELGRTYASTAHPPETQTDAVRAQARHAYERAAALAKEGSLDNLAIDALHMLAVVEIDPDEQLKWNLAALNSAENSPQPAARKWTGSLHHNIGYTLHQLSRYDEALAHFQQALAARQETGDAESIRIAHWMIAWTYRTMGRFSEALAIQLRLEAECAAAAAPDPYVFEELEQIYRALGQADQAEHYARLLAEARS